MTIEIIEHGDQSVFSGIVRITDAPLAQFAPNQGHVHGVVYSLESSGWKPWARRSAGGLLDRAGEEPWPGCVWS